MSEIYSILEKDDFIFERMIDGIPVNYVRETSLPVNEQALEWENEDGTLHEGQSEGWENEVLTMDFCSGTIQSFLHRNRKTGEKRWQDRQTVRVVQITYTMKNPIATAVK